VRKNTITSKDVVFRWHNQQLHFPNSQALPYLSCFQKLTPKPLDVLSQAIIANNTVYCSGAVGIDPSTMTMVSGTVADRTVSS
jgi:enamine deaminase RidA (YjgF/YER057c/UK114 family)